MDKTNPHEITLSFELLRQSDSDFIALPFGLKKDISYIYFRGSSYSEFGVIRFKTAAATVYHASANDGAAHGVPKIANKAVKVKVYPWFSSELFGRAKVVNARHEIKASGLDSFQQGIRKALEDKDFSPPTIFNAQQWLTWKTGQQLNSLLFGRHSVTHYLQYIEFAGLSFSAAGRPRISYVIQQIEPRSFNWREQKFSPYHKVSPTQHVGPEGLDSARYLTRIIPENSMVYQDKGLDTLWGEHAIKNRRKIIRPDPMSADNLFSHVVFNSRQYIIGTEEEQEQINPLDFGFWGLRAENQNKEISPNWFIGTKWGWADFTLKARVLNDIEGILSQVIGDAFISHKIRRVKNEPLDSQVFSNWHSLHTNRKVVKTSWFNEETVSTRARVWNNRRYLPRLVGFDTPEYGRPFIDFARRTIEQNSDGFLHMIPPPAMPMPSISNSKRYLAPSGLDGNEYGIADFVEHWNIVAPKWDAKDSWKKMGVPDVANHNKNFRIWGWDFGEVSSLAHIFNHNRFLPLDGLNNGGFGTHWVSNNIRYIYAGGFTQFAISKTGNDVWTNRTPPFSPQSIILEFVDKDGARHPESWGYGIDSNKYAWGNTRLRDNAIRLEDKGIDSLKIGSPIIRNNSIKIEVGIHPPLVNYPDVMLKNRVISLEGYFDRNGNYVEGHGIKCENFTEDNRPDFSPRTIWVMANAGEQARRNHKPTGVFKSPSEGGEFGKLQVIYNDGKINLNPSRLDDISKYIGGRRGATIFGDNTTITNSRRYIKPKSIHQFRMGWVYFMPYEQEIDLDEEGANDGRKGDMMTFGRLSIGFPWEYDGNVHIHGLDGAVWGKNVVANFNQDVKPAGFTHTTMGHSLGYDNPFMWQGLRIGERVPTNFGGMDTQIFGSDTFISYLNRELMIDGFDAFISEPDIRKFSERMIVYRVKDVPPDNRVKHRIKRGSFEQTLRAQSIGFSPFGNHDIKNKAQFIRPDGYADQFRKGASIWQK